MEEYVDGFFSKGRLNRWGDPILMVRDEQQSIGPVRRDCCRFILVDEFAIYSPYAAQGRKKQTFLIGSDVVDLYQR